MTQQMVLLPSPVETTVLTHPLPHTHIHVRILLEALVNRSSRHTHTVIYGYPPATFRNVRYIPLASPFLPRAIRPAEFTSLWRRFSARGVLPAVQTLNYYYCERDVLSLAPTTALFLMSRPEYWTSLQTSSALPVSRDKG